MQEDDTRRDDDDGGSEGITHTNASTQARPESCCTCKCFCRWVGFYGLHYSVIFAITTLIHFDYLWPAALVLCTLYMVGLLCTVSSDFKKRRSVAKPENAKVPEEDDQNNDQQGSTSFSTNPETEDGASSKSVATGENSIHDEDVSQTATVTPPPDDEDGIILDQDGNDKGLLARRKPYSIMISLLYALTLLSLGGPSAILIFQVVPCTSEYFESYDQDIKHWSVNATLLPASLDVQRWVRETGESDFPYPSEMQSSFCELQELNEVYFIAHDRSSLEKLTNEGQDPQFYSPKEAYARSPDEIVTLHVKKAGEKTIRLNTGNITDLPKLNRPIWLTRVKADACCLVIGGSIWCGNYDKGFQKFDKTDQNEYRKMKGINDLLWFRYVTRKNYNKQLGTAVGSLNISTGEIKQYSTLQEINHNNRFRDGWPRHRSLEDVVKEDAKEGEEDGDEEVEASDDVVLNESFREDFKPTYAKCSYYESVNRLRSILGLLLVGMPISAASAWLWSRFAVPSSPITLYVGVGLVLSFMGGIVNKTDGFTTVAFAWMAVGAPLFVLVSAFWIALNTRLSKPPLWWILYGLTVPTAFMGIMVALENMLYELVNKDYFYPDEMVFPLASTIVGFLPLAFVGTLVGSKLLFVLAGIGINVDSIFLTLSTAGVLSSSADSTSWIVAAVVSAVLFVVLTLAFGWMTRNLGMLHDRLIRFVLKCARQVCVVRGEDFSDAIVDEATTERLLDNNQGETEHEENVEDENGADIESSQELV